MNRLDRIFEFLNKFGGTSFIADKNKANYNEERYNEIQNLKTKVYDEDLINLFDDIYNKLKYKDNKVKCKIRSWQNSGNIYDYCWLQIKDKARDNSASMIAILIQKERIAINLEYHHKFKNSKNSSNEHNKYILYLDEWIKKI